MKKTETSKHYAIEQNATTQYLSHWRCRCLSCPRASKRNPLNGIINLDKASAGSSTITCVEVLSLDWLLLKMVMYILPDRDHRRPLKNTLS